MKNLKGFTLVELMVAILVLAIGLLGLAGLQAVSLSGNHNAYLRTQATLLAQDMADRMRTAAYPPSDLAFYLAGATEDDCAVASCTAEQMAGYDVSRWNDNIAKQLPGGTGKITEVGGGIYTISITWIERENNQNAPNNLGGKVQKTFDMSFQP